MKNRQELSVAPLISGLNESHYFKQSNDAYIRDGIRIVEQLLAGLTERNKKALLYNKLQLNSKNFNENQFIQHACEITAASYFIEKFPNLFFYERVIVKPKDVDFSFIADGLRINVEVKTFSRENIVTGKTPIKIIGPQFKAEAYLELESQLPEYFKLARSRRVAMSKFIADGNLKFGKPSTAGEVNLLMICCYDFYDFADVFLSMTGTHGLATPKATQAMEILDFSLDLNLHDAPNIDGVVINNLADNHLALHDQSSTYPINPWLYKNCLTFGVATEPKKAKYTDNQLFLLKHSMNYSNDNYLEYCREEQLNYADIVSLKEFINSLRRQNGYYFSNQQVA